MIKINHQFEEVKIVGKLSLGSQLNKVAIRWWGESIEGMILVIRSCVGGMALPRCKGFINNPLLPILRTQDKEYQNVNCN